MTNRQNNEGLFQKLKARPFWQRLALFVIIAFIWFMVISLVDGDSEGTVSNARDTQSYWLLTVLFFAILSPLFFKYKRGDEKIDE